MDRALRIRPKLVCFASWHEFHDQLQVVFSVDNFQYLVQYTDRLVGIQEHSAITLDKTLKNIWSNSS